MSKHAKHCTQPDIDDTPHLSGQKKGGKDESNGHVATEGRC
jgi:hypothetical protein